MLGAEVTLGMLEADPYPVFASLQDHEQVAFVPSLDMWLVTRWDDVVFVCEHPELFRNNTDPSWLRDCLGENMLTLDDAAHDRLADGMRPPFVSSTALPVVREGLPALFDDLIDGFDGAGVVELMTAYAEPLANLTLAAALGWSVDWRDLAAVEPRCVHRHRQLRERPGEGCHRRDHPAGRTLRLRIPRAAGPSCHALQVTTVRTRHATIDRRLSVQ